MSLPRGFYALPATAFGLGCWQVYRWRWKQSLLEHRQQQQEHEVEALPELREVDAEEARALEFRSFRARGRFEHEAAVRVGPRSYEGVSGAHLVVPLRLESGECVLVNRGWVPRELDAPLHEPRGTLDVRGVLRRGERPGRFTPPNDPERRQWFFMDHEALAAFTGCSPAARLDEELDSSRRTAPIGGQTSFWLPDNHLIYVATWFGLAAALTIMMARRRRIK